MTSCLLHSTLADILASHPYSALMKLLELVMPVLLETVRTEPEREVAMAIVESMNNVIKSCKGEVFKNPMRLKEVCFVIRDLLKKKVKHR